VGIEPYAIAITSNDAPSSPRGRSTSASAIVPGGYLEAKLSCGDSTGVATRIMPSSVCAAKSRFLYAKSAERRFIAVAPRTDSVLVTAQNDALRGRRRSPSTKYGTNGL
jgi:hypothetical protein